MCFAIIRPIEAKITEKDIVCYKAFKRKRKDVYITPFTGHNYISGELQPTVKITPNKRKCIINRGYHSYKKRVSGMCSLWTSYVKKCIIPAGTRYYENEKEYVSETIKML